MKTSFHYSILLFSTLMFILAPFADCYASEKTIIRLASFNIASGLSKAAELDNKLVKKDDPKLLKIAAIIQKTRADILLLNEFDFNPDIDQAALFQRNYLAYGQSGEIAIKYPYSWSGPVNTGINSKLDLNNNGKTGEPADAWGFGFFPGQYGMLVLSRYPIEEQHIRSFQKLRWASMPNALKPMAQGTSPKSTYKSTPESTPETTSKFTPKASKSWYPESTWQQLRLSSKSHWDIPISIEGKTLHFLVMHPTPPVFDGPEDRNGLRNHDEIRLFADYIDPQRSAWIVDDKGQAGGLAANSLFVIAGDFNADPIDGDSSHQAIDQLLNHPQINASCVPQSKGAVGDSQQQAGRNLTHKGNPASDTGKFNPKYVGNLRLDYVLPASQISVKKCGVFWPEPDQTGAQWLDASDHHLVWLDITI